MIDFRWSSLASLTGRVSVRLQMHAEFSDTRAAHPGESYVDYYKGNGNIQFELVTNVFGSCCAETGILDCRLWKDGDSERINQLNAKDVNFLMTSASAAASTPSAANAAVTTASAALAAVPTETDVGAAATKSSLGTATTVGVATTVLTTTTGGTATTGGAATVWTPNDGIHRIH